MYGFHYQPVIYDTPSPPPKSAEGEAAGPLRKGRGPPHKDQTGQKGEERGQRAEARRERARDDFGRGANAPANARKGKRNGKGGGANAPRSAADGRRDAGFVQDDSAAFQAMEWENKARRREAMAAGGVQ